MAMNKNAASPRSVNSRLGRIPLALIAVLATSLVALAGTAGAAAPVGKDGQIHACYRVKGKPKGGLRVVPSARSRCKRGERKVVWSVAGSSGQGGTSGQTANGQTGSSGQQGSAGTNGSSNEAALKTEVADLTFKLEALEGLLEGIGKGDLNGLLGKVGNLEGVLDGVSNSELTKTIDAVPVLETACQQLTSQSNLLGTEFGSLVTTLGGTLLGAIFGGIDVPPALDPLDCTTP
jgi:hypothetical protein